MFNREAPNREASIDYVGDCTRRPLTFPRATAVPWAACGSGPRRPPDYWSDILVPFVSANADARRGRRPRGGGLFRLSISATLASSPFCIIRSSASLQNASRFPGFVEMASGRAMPQVWYPWIRFGYLAVLVFAFLVARLVWAA
jgi:hypothetical protein